MVQVKRAMTAAPDFAYLFRKCCEQRSGDRPSCRGLQVALEAQAADAQVQMCSTQAEAAIAEAQAATTRANLAETAAADAERRAEQADVPRELARQLCDALSAQGYQRTPTAAEQEVNDREAQEERGTNAELTQRLAAVERRVAEAEAARPLPCHRTFWVWPVGVALVAVLAVFIGLNVGVPPDVDAVTNLEAAMRILNHGVGPYPPCEEAVRLLRSPAVQGNPDALCELGVCLAQGRGVHSNQTEAKELLREAVAKGSVEAAGYLAHLDPDYRRTAPPDLVDAALARWRERAEEGHADAQQSLGRCYADRIGVTQDVAEAARWYRLAADQGHATALNNLGNLHATGYDGISKDVVEAVRLYRLSAEQGCAAGLTSLGVCYHNGKGVRKDMTKAAQLYRLAADQGDATAQNNLGVFYENGSGGISKDVVEAVRLYRLSADQGTKFGQRNLGRCYMKGIGVEKDLVEARRWLTLSADQGDARARVLLAQLS